jgi:hypothetical protein
VLSEISLPKGQYDKKGGRPKKIIVFIFSNDRGEDDNIISGQQKRSEQCQSDGNKAKIEVTKRNDWEKDDDDDDPVIDKRPKSVRK